MANVNPPKKNQAWSTDVVLEDLSNEGRIKLSPTLAAGDVKISIDNGALANITTLPSEAPSGSGIIDVDLTAGEMNGDKITIRFRDQTDPPEWADRTITILTTA